MNFASNCIPSFEDLVASDRTFPLERGDQTYSASRT